MIIFNPASDVRLHGRYHSPLSRALAQFTGALGQVGPVINDDDFDDDDDDDRAQFTGALAQVVYTVFLALP